MSKNRIRPKYFREINRNIKRRKKEMEEYRKYIPHLGMFDSPNSFFAWFGMINALFEMEPYLDLIDCCEYVSTYVFISTLSIEIKSQYIECLFSDKQSDCDKYYCNLIKDKGL